MTPFKFVHDNQDVFLKPFKTVVYILFDVMFVNLNRRQTRNVNTFHLDIRQDD